MEEYEDIECDAPDATTTMEEQENDLNRRMIRQAEKGIEGKLVGNSGVLKVTSGNAAKRLKLRQETRATTGAGKTAEAAVKQLANQELQIEKARMEGWKQMVMTEVALELQGIKQAHEEAMTIQRQTLQLELERMKQKLEIVEGEVQLLKCRKPTLEKELAQSIHPNTSHLNTPQPGMKNQLQPSTQRKSPENLAGAIGKVLDTSTLGNRDDTPASHFGSTKNTQKRNYASVAASKPTQSPDHPWTQVVYKNRKQEAKKPAVRKFEPAQRRILFPREEAQPKKSEEDIMLALNEALQKAGEPAFVRFSRVGYSASGAISALLTEKSDAVELLKTRSNALIRAAKTVDRAVIGVEALERWHRLKVHGMSLERYLGDGKMELFGREIESSTGIRLKSTPRWLIPESRLRERQDSGNNRGSAIVITVANISDVVYLCAKGLKFGGALKVVEKYWEAGPGSVCPICCGIGHDRPGNCGNRPAKCGLHKLEEHKCGVSGCRAGWGKICVHVTATCGNCQGNHQATSTKCLVRQKAEREARKMKNNSHDGKTSELGEPPANSEKPSEGPEEANPDLDMDNDDWARSPGSPLSSVEDPKSPDAEDRW